MQQVKPTNSNYLQQNHISALAFSQSCEYCAVGIKKTSCFRIYKTNEFNNIQSWELVQQNKDHTQTISDIHWAADDKIISVSHDRSAVVWKKSNSGKWEKMLVNIDIKLSILSARWSPSCKKFALGSACKTTAIGFYNIQSMCWTIAYRRLTKSPVTTLSFHPSSNILAIGSTDYSVQLISCSFKKSKQQFIQKSNPEDSYYNGPFKDIDTLFEVLFSIENVGGWINYLSFENHGQTLLVFPHNNHFKCFNLNENLPIKPQQIDITWQKLPFMSGYINSQGDIIAGGFDNVVCLFKRQNNTYVFSKYFSKNQKTNSTRKKGLVAISKKGIETGATNFGQAPQQQQHQNTIKVFQLQKTKMPCSYDINGNIHFWQV